MTDVGVAFDLQSFGISSANAIAGLSGGLLNILFFRKKDPWDAITALVAGTVTAAYLGQFLSDTIHFPAQVVSLTVGFCGLSIIVMMSSMLRTRLNGGQTPNEGTRNGKSA